MTTERASDNLRTRRAAHVDIAALASQLSSLRGSAACRLRDVPWAHSFVGNGFDALARRDRVFVHVVGRVGMSVGRLVAFLARAAAAMLAAAAPGLHRAVVVGRPALRI